MNKFELINALALTELGRNEIALMNYFVLRSDSELKCFPCVKTIVAGTKLCETVYKKTVKRLIDLGLVRREFRYNKITGQQRSNYFFLSDEIFTLPVSEIINKINIAIRSLKKTLGKKQDESLKLPRRSVANRLNSVKGKAAKAMAYMRLNVCHTLSSLHRIFHKTKVRTAHSQMCFKREKLMGRGRNITPYITTILFLKKKKYSYLYRNR